ncbi:MAG: tRNA pseudouridine(55) synthase TruB [candidate division Zixibacteria bacterium]|nr:tRNA pseudouridine(55) synthase TruB [candidate division Zixibacteria bacterium]
MAAFTIGGVINVDKARGPTSHDVVDVVRQALGIRRVGHAGTLDPAARGVLPILFGRVTRLARFFVGYKKEYRAVIKLGAETSSGDEEGEVVYERAVPADTYGALAAVARSFVGEIVQRVPTFSAVKHRGEPLYRKARRGDAVAAPSRTVSVYRLEVIDVTPPTFTALVECGGGTYVRALARDIGRKLGVGAHVVDLVRLAVGPFVLGQALPQSRLQEADLDAVLCPPHFTHAAALLPELPAVRLSAAGVTAAVQGRPVPVPEPLSPGGAVRLLSDDGGLVGVGVATAGGQVKPDTILVKAEELGDS